MSGPPLRSSCLLLALTSALAGSLPPAWSEDRPTPEPSSPELLIARLGAPRYADREAAARSLETLGRSALSPLRGARDDRDPEIRSRAAILLDRIERDLLLRPTPVSLPADSTTVRQAVEFIATQLGTPLSIAEPGLGDRLLVPSSDSDDGEKPTFWKFFEEQHLDLAIAPDRRAERIDLTRPSIPRVMTRTPSNLRRVQIHGPFRVSIEPVVSRKSSSGGRPVSFNLTLSITVMAEPRLAIRPDAAIRLLEISDDLGRRWSLAEEIEPDLLPAPPSQELPRPVQVFALRLNPPQGPPARSLRIRGAIPVRVEARKLDPIVIDLPADEGKPHWCGDVTLIARATAENAGSPAHLLDLTIRPPDWTMPMGRGARPRMFEFFNNHIIRIFESLELADEQDRPISIMDTRRMGLSNEGFRMSLALELPEPASRLTRLRFFGRLQTPHEIPISFDDIPLPQP